MEVHWANGNDFCFVSGHDNFLRSADVFKKPDRLFVDAIVQIFLVHDKRFIVGENELSVDVCFVDLMTLIIHDNCFKWLLNLFLNQFESVLFVRVTIDCQHLIGVVF